MSKPQDFKALQKLWYDKLKATGFDDIEYADGSLRGKTNVVGRELVNIEAIKDYYYMATHFLNDYEFPDEFSKIIWENHSNGIGTRDIATILAKKGFKKFKKSKISLLIQDLQKTMRFMYADVAGNG